MEINVPNLDQQHRFIFKKATHEAIQQLEKNLQAPVIKDLNIDETQFSNEHLLVRERWKPPHPDIVYAYIEQFKQHSSYQSDQAVADYLGLKGKNGERRLRAYKTGKESPPFDIWRKLLVATGRVPQEIIPVVAFLK